MTSETVADDNPKCCARAFRLIEPPPASWLDGDCADFRVILAISTRRVVWHKASQRAR